MQNTPFGDSLQLTPEAQTPHTDHTWDHANLFRNFETNEVILKSINRCNALPKLRRDITGSSQHCLLEFAAIGEIVWCLKHTQRKKEGLTGHCQTYICWWTRSHWGLPCATSQPQPSIHEEWVLCCAFTRIISVVSMLYAIERLAWEGWNVWAAAHVLSGKVPSAKAPPMMAL